MRIVREWLAEMVDVPADTARVAHDISLRGFEVAAVEGGVIDFEITANRPDCLSHLGIAREAATIYGTPLRHPVANNQREGGSGNLDSSAVTSPKAEAELQVRVEDPDLCPRYCAQLFEVTLGPSPSWLTDRLTAAGVRPITNIVDVTNYVMLELGQPMHAFDLDRVADRTLVIRRAREGEKLCTLDGIERPLDPAMLVIADARRATAVGGVMGGAESEIGPSTRLMALESAFFEPTSVRQTSKRLALRTEASIRFERGADIDAPPLGIARAAALLEKLGAGRAVGPLVDIYPRRHEPRVLTLRHARIAHILGTEVPEADVVRYLTSLGFTIESRSTPHGPRSTIHDYRVMVPSHRVDVTREVDLIEEVGRHHGFDRIPVTFPTLRWPHPAADARIGRDARIRTVLTAAGFSEATSFAFIDAAAAEACSPVGFTPAAISNPLSEKFAVLRPSLLPGLVDACAHNRRRGIADVRLFETGSRFGPEGERRAVGRVWSGGGVAAHWSGAARGVDFFDVSGAAEQVCRALQVPEVEFAPASVAFLAAGRAAELRAGGHVIGIAGQLRREIAEARGLPRGEEVFVAELDTDALAALAGGEELRAKPLPKYPAIVRDVSILVDETLPAAAVRGTIRSAAPDTLESVAEFDRYHGTGVPEGRTSLSLRLTFRSAERTLTDEDVDAAMDSIVRALAAAHGAVRR